MAVVVPNSAKFAHLPDVGRVRRERLVGLVCSYRVEFGVFCLFATGWGRHERSSRGVKSGPVLTTLLLTDLLTTIPGGEKTDDLGPGPRRRPPMAAGTSIFAFSTSNRAVLTTIRATPSNGRPLRVSKKPLLGRIWANLGRHCVARGGPARVRQRRCSPGGAFCAALGEWHGH